MAEINDSITDCISQMDESLLISENIDTSDISKLLLLGGTGCGKSTFINYLTNYFKGGTLNDLKVAVPTRFYPKSTEGINHSENDAHDPTKSQTTTCHQYLFEDQQTGKQYLFVDTPGLGDVGGYTQDEINIKRIREAVIKLGSLTAVVIIMNGTDVRLNTSMKIILALLWGFLPNVVMESVILVLTNSKEHTYNFYLDTLRLDGSTVYLFCMENSAFSRPAEKRTANGLRGLMQEWSESMGSIKEILNTITSFTQISVKAFTEMRETQDEIRAKMHATRLQIVEIQKMQNELAAYEEAVQQCGEEQMSFKDFIQVEKIKQKALIESSTHNTLCSACHFVCHQNCQLDEITMAGDQLFTQCSAMSAFGNRCSRCPKQCSYGRHYHGFYKIEEIEGTRDKILHHIKARYDQATSNLEIFQQKIRTATETTTVLDAAVTEHCEAIKEMCRQLKTICAGFDLAQELHAVIEQMRTESLQLVSVTAKEKMQQTIESLCAFCDRIQVHYEKTKNHSPMKIIEKGQEISIRQPITLAQPSEDIHRQKILAVQALLKKKAPNQQLPQSPPAVAGVQVKIHRLSILRELLHQFSRMIRCHHIHRIQVSHTQKK